MRVCSTSSTSTLTLPRASASRASDVINMVKSSVFTVKNTWLSCLECAADSSILQMPHALGLVVGLPYSNRPRQEAVFVLFIISMKLYVA